MVCSGLLSLIHVDSLLNQLHEYFRIPQSKFVESPCSSDGYMCSCKMLDILLYELLLEF